MMSAGLQSAKLESIEEYVPNLIARVTVFESEKSDEQEILADDLDKEDQEKEIERVEYTIKRLLWYREQGYLPEAICNYLALLGWSPGDDRENISMKELTELFTVEKVHSSPARFDMKKLEAINGDKIRALTLDEFLKWSLPFLTKADVITGTDAEIELVKKALPLILNTTWDLNQ